MAMAFQRPVASLQSHPSGPARCENPYRHSLAESTLRPPTLEQIQEALSKYIRYYALLQPK